MPPPWLLICVPGELVKAWRPGCPPAWSVRPSKGGAQAPGLLCVRAAGRPLSREVEKPDVGSALIHGTAGGARSGSRAPGGRGQKISEPSVVLANSLPRAGWPHDVLGAGQPEQQKLASSHLWSRAPRTRSRPVSSQAWLLPGSPQGLPSVCVPVLISSLHKDTSQTRSGPT